MMENKERHSLQSISDYDPNKRVASKVEKALELACWNFVRKVQSGRATSRKSFEEMSKALLLTGNYRKLRDENNECWTCANSDFGCCMCVRIVKTDEAKKQ